MSVWLQNLCQVVAEMGPLRADRLSPAHQTALDDFIAQNGLTATTINNEVSDKRVYGYVVLEAAIAKADSVEWKLVAAAVCEKLKFPQKRWNWRDSANETYYHHLRLLRALLDSLVAAENEEIRWKLIELASCYCNPHVPWSSEVNSAIVISCLTPQLRNTLYGQADTFVEMVKPNLLKLSKSPSSRKTPSKFKVTGLRPQLGLTIAEDDERQTWKESTKVKSLSMVWFLIALFENNEVFEKHWPLVTSFTLNLLDDPLPLFKAQGCFLLFHFMNFLETRADSSIHLFTKTGLTKLFADSVKNCLTYLPLITPADDSLHLLTSAFPPLYKLLSIGNPSRSDNCKTYIEVLNEDVLASIHHIQDRDDSITLHIFLLQQASIIIKYHLKQDIFVSLNKLNSQLSFTIMNPITIDKPQGIDLVAESIGIQRLIIQLVLETKDLEAYELILGYKYDFLAAWSIIVTRLKKTSYDWRQIAEEIQVCVKNLNTMSPLGNLNDDIIKLQAKYPEIEGIIAI